MSQNIVPVFPVYFIWGLFKRIFNTIFLCLFLPIFSFAAGNFQKGYEAHLRGAFSAAIKAWGPLAAQGDAAAQFNIGNLFVFGKGVREDNVQAAYWYNKSAEQDNVNAQYALGWMYENGEGVKKDLVKALLWYKKAADQKHSGAQTNLGWMYENGKGVELDHTQAVFWYKKAAKQGSYKAKQMIEELELESVSVDD